MLKRWSLHSIRCAVKSKFLKRCIQNWFPSQSNALVHVPEFGNTSHCSLFLQPCIYTSNLISQLCPPSCSVFGTPLEGQGPSPYNKPENILIFTLLPRSHIQEPTVRYCQPSDSSNPPVCFFLSCPSSEHSESAPALHSLQDGTCQRYDGLQWSQTN